MRNINNVTKMLVMRDRLADLFKEAGVKISEEGLINVSEDIEHVFNGCYTKEEAIQRIKELNSISVF